MAKDLGGGTNYQHKPFRDKNSIRLVELQPGCHHDEIHVALIDVSLSNPPEYEALSYVWGSRIPNKPVFCGYKKILVTENCLDALRRLRHKKRPRIHWIDSICIDQNSELERGHQVQLMGDVYSKAEKVIIWLGEASPWSDFTMSFFNDYYDFSNQARWVIPGIFSGGIIKDVHMKMLIRREMIARDEGFSSFDVLNSICDRAWFTRVWAVQEYVLSREAYFMCGAKTLPVKKMFSMIWKITARRSRYYDGPTHRNPLNNPIKVYATLFDQLRKSLKDSISEPILLSDLLSQSRAQMATNPKDAVYGKYGLLQRLNIPVPAADYSKSVEVIFTETTKAAITNDRVLSVLWETSESELWPGLPSWVPDWSVEGHHALSRDLIGNAFKASMMSSCSFKFLNEGNVLAARGIIVDRVKCRPGSTKTTVWTSRKDLEDTSLESGFLPDSIREPLQEWVNVASHLSSYSTGESVEQALCRTLIHHKGQLVHMEESPDEYHLDEQASFRAWLEILFESVELLESNHSKNERIVVDGLYWRFEEIARKNSHPSNADEDTVRGLRNKSAKRYLDWMVDCSKGTTFFTTVSGFMGKGLMAIQENDLVVLIAGLDIPMIVREVSDIGNYHRLMGPAYVHGMMYGERWPDYDNGLSYINFCWMSTGHNHGLPIHQ